MFVNDGLDADDVHQGKKLGDCWFLSALSSLAGVPGDNHEKLKEQTLDKVVQKQFNCSDKAKNAGVFRFKVIFIRNPL